MKSKLFIHKKNDYVGVAVLPIKAGEQVKAFIMSDGEKFSIKSNDDIQVGHKLALKLINKGEHVLKHGYSIGIAIQDIPKGCHVHVHNLKSKKKGW